MAGISRSGKYRFSALLAALIGSYAFVWGLTSFGIALMVNFDVDFHVAEAGMFILAFPLMLILFLWSFIRNHLALWLLLFVGASLLSVGGWLLQLRLLN